MNDQIHSVKRGDKGRRSRDRVLHEATRLFGLYGYSAVTLREIGAAAGLDNSTIYRYFSSKEELAAEVVLHMLSELTPVARKFESTDAPTLQQLVDGAVAFSEFLWKRRDIARLLLGWMSTTGDPRSGFGYSVNLAAQIEHPAAKLVGNLLLWFARAQETGAIRPVAPLDALINILALVVVRPATEGYFLHSLERNVNDAVRRHASEAELRAAISGAFAPQRN